MAILLTMNFTGTTQQQYDTVCDIIGFPDVKPDGLLVHLAAKSPQGFRVIDCWESKQQFDRFFEEKLESALKQAKLPQPQIETLTPHRVYSERPLVQTI